LHCKNCKLDLIFTYIPNLDIPPKILRGGLTKEYFREKHCFMKKGATNTNGIEGLMPAELVKLFYEKRVSKYGRLTVMFIRKILGYPI
jgi:hypothetical protein